MLRCSAKKMKKTRNFEKEFEFSERNMIPAIRKARFPCRTWFEKYILHFFQVDSFLLQ